MSLEDFGDGNAIAGDGRQRNLGTDCVFLFRSLPRVVMSAAYGITFRVASIMLAPVLLLSESPYVSLMLRRKPQPQSTGPSPAFAKSRLVKCLFSFGNACSHIGLQ